MSTTDRRKGVAQLTVHIPDAAARTPPPTSRSRWSTLEFRLYALAFAVVVPLMVWVPISLSSESHPNYPNYAYRLSDGWIPGRKVDISDPQYRTFRQNIPALIALSTVFLVSSRIFTAVRPLTFPTATKTHFLVAFEVVMLLVLHGVGAFKIGLIIVLNWALVTWSVQRVRAGHAPACLTPTIVWVFNGLTIFANDYYGGYSLKAIHPSLAPLDSYSGLLPRWHVNFNITMLRLISFGMDYHWASLQQSSNRPLSHSTATTAMPTTYRERVTTSLPLSECSLTNFFAYAVYPALYIAGPIMSFNDFTHQLRHPNPPTRQALFSYAMRFATCFLTMELVLHYMYVVAIKDSGAWQGDTPAELCMIGFWNLIVVWLKLLVPWRFFRLWALADGMDPPENMVRCMANNYSTLGFWRSWHRSYNLWTVRYIYVPLGGSNNIVLATTLVFTFVALWHDLSFRLLAWGWLVSLFILPEIIGRKMLPVSKYGHATWYRHLCALGAVLNNLLMMIANLVGFVLGADGVRYMLQQLVATWQSHV
ncbi:hypothetical protein QFC20_003019 [Naganishia adeliensis]|uniref:Uncharacterized protein n=1 Tax=Naganishia adeliensis TaxID=92952 RepID=A0ACC2WET4_9TREE|nr:hypothetical protein QFC20_003019 [Naganishia adeliensis]